MEIATIGLDLAKQVFQVHGVDEAGQAVVKRRLRRAQVITYFASLPPCLIGMEACATAHFWARELRSLGQEVRLMPPQYVKAYVKRGKNDAADGPRRLGGGGQGAELSAGSSGIGRACLSVTLAREGNVMG